MELQIQEGTVERLRASKGKADARREAEGKEAGQAWAKDRAEAEELERLAEFSETDAFLFGLGSGMDDHAFSEADNLFLTVLYPDEGNCRRHANEWWREQLDDKRHLVDNPAFLKGFILGAVEVWDAVKDQL